MQNDELVFVETLWTQQEWMNITDNRNTVIDEECGLLTIVLLVSALSRYLARIVLILTG